MKSSEIRNSFLKFFSDRGHTIVPSAPVIPHDDPTLLFTNAGMNQFKDVFLGKGKRGYVRAADSQKCIRVSGKHNDLEEVGIDTYHHTFFEMLGNWSFGDYYKKDAIEWAWELLTEVWGLDKKRLYATVYETDTEAEDLWKKNTDIDPTRVLRFGKKDNFWEMGETGPCGPCSEIHIDLTDDLSGCSLVNAGDPRVMEIWNLVFIQYNRDENGTLTPLPAMHVDTGMGFERMCAVLQQKKSNYDTDVFIPIINRVTELAGKVYTSKLNSPSDIAMRVISDHVRMLSFSIADGGIPSNEGRGYVMRRILRRAARFGRTLGLHEPFLYKVVDAVIKSMGGHYPEIGERKSHIEKIIRGEEESFNQTLDRGLDIFESVVVRLGDSKIFPGEDAFKLFDTFGFPLDLTEMMATERGLKVDSGRFAHLMEVQRDRARKASKKFDSKQVAVQVQDLPQHDVSRFVGYENFEVETEVISASGDQIVLKETPFYSESGGQVSDTGEIIIGGQNFQVIDVKKSAGVIIHKTSTAVSLPALTKVKAKVDIPRRKNIMRNHTVTHLLHEALRVVLGDHLHQQGSLVAPDRLRFDFNHFEKITPEQIKAIEKLVNEKIAEKIPVISLNDPSEWLTIDEAKRRYPKLKMYFGEKYGDRVRVVEVKNFTAELCGGTHVRNTGDIGFFKIISESGIASGIRRIEAVTGDGAVRYAEERVARIHELDQQLKDLQNEKSAMEKQLGRPHSVDNHKKTSMHSFNAPVEVLNTGVIEEIELAIQRREDEIEKISKYLNDLRKEISLNRVEVAGGELDSILAGATVLGKIRIASGQVKVLNNDELKKVGDSLREKLESGIGVLGAVIDNKVGLVCVVTDDLLKDKRFHAGNIVGEVARRLGGGGGGRPHLATAGGRDVSRLDSVLSEVPAIVESMINKK
jgi:alanyl-tRNA synthetase